MDGNDNRLDNPNMNRIPTYALYGEHEQPLIPESLHIESIAQRSRLYDWEIRPHRHDLFAQLLCLRLGQGEALFEEERQAFTAPCVIFVPALAVHGFRFSRDMDGTIMTVVSRHVAALLQAVPEVRSRLEAPHCLHFPVGSGEFARIEATLAAIGEELAGDAPWRMAAIESALTMALLLTGRAIAAGLGQGRVAASRSLQHAERFRALLDRWFREERSIAFYAGQMGITPTQLNRVCREVLDNSALGALHARLVLEAKRDLAYTLLSVKEIALTLGFADAAYFTRFFAKETGLAPSAFREAARRQLRQAPPQGRIGSSRSSRYLR